MRTLRFAGFALISLFSVGNVFGADPRLLNLVMPDARSVAGANVLAASTTPFGQYVLSHVNSMIDQQLGAFIKTTGFDPRHDVTEFLAASVGRTAGQKTVPPSIVAVLGNFHVDQITAAAAKIPQLGVQSYNGATLLTSSPKNGIAVAFLGSEIAVVGDVASVEAAVDRSAGANAVDPALATRIQALSTTEDAWGISMEPVGSMIPNVMPGGAGSSGSPEVQIVQMLSGIQSSSGGIKFGTNIDISGQAIMSDEKNAKALADVVQAMAAIFSMGSAQNPEAASVASVLQSLKVTADGTAINLSMSIPEAQVENILKGLQNGPSKAVVKPALLHR